MDTQDQISDYVLPPGSTSFTATFGLDDQSQDDSTRVRVTIFGNSPSISHKQLWTHDIAYGKPVQAQLDVRGVTRMSFELTFLSGSKPFAGCNEALPVMGSPQLTVAGE